MSNVKLNLNSILICLLELIIGILLLIDPIGFTAGIIIFFGAGLLVFGLVSIFRYFRADPVEASQGSLLAAGLISILIGGFCALYSEWIILTFPIITVFYGVVILLTSMTKIQWTVDMLRLKSGKWYLCAISAAASTICGVLIVIDPFTSTGILWMFVSISLIVEAVFDVVALILRKNSAGGNIITTEIVDAEPAGADDSKDGIN